MPTNEHGNTISAELEKSCAQEAIHLLGTVQPYGFLMAVDIGTGKIAQVSSGIVRHWPGLQSASRLIATPLSDWVAGTTPTETIDLAALPNTHTVLRQWRPRFEQTAVDVPQPAATAWECLCHRTGALAILEWLPADNCAHGERYQWELFSDFAAALARLRHAAGLDSFFHECTEVIQDFSGFDRVMIYRFLEDGSGQVVAEHTSANYQRKYEGLRFPASDIPGQARSLYLLNKLRILADVEATADTLIPASSPDGTLLDQSLGILRGLSLVHLSYLRNMGVRATLTLSLVCDGKLWGLIACHHHRPMTPPHQVREGLRQLCELLAEIVSMRVDALSHLESMRARVALDAMLNQFHQTLIQEGDLSNLLDPWLPKLLAAFHASDLGVRIGNLVYLGGRGKRSGSPQRSSRKSPPGWTGKIARRWCSHGIAC